MTTALKRTRLGVLGAVLLCAWAALVGCAGHSAPVTQQYYVMVFDDAAPATDAAFNACFDDQRIPDARTLPGFVSAPFVIGSFVILFFTPIMPHLPKTLIPPVGETRRFF